MKTYTLLGSDRRPYPSSLPGTWGGHRRSSIYGRLDCPSALRALARGGYAQHRVFFADEAIAIAAGYRPCGICCPERYRAWRQAG
jgi:methylphosphotriester-DNA--protein-cysteine methyltransferase